MKALPKDLRYLLFDLDGTLTDSAEGILRCVQYALEQCGTPEPDAEKLRPFIGPPLLDSFQEFCGMPPARPPKTFFPMRFSHLKSASGVRPTRKFPARWVSWAKFTA